MRKLWTLSVPSTATLHHGNQSFRQNATAATDIKVKQEMIMATLLKFKRCKKRRMSVILVHFFECGGIY